MSLQGPEGDSVCRILSYAILYIFTFTKAVMFLPAFVCLFVYLLVGWLVGWLVSSNSNHNFGQITVLLLFFFFFTLTNFSFHLRLLEQI